MIFRAALIGCGRIGSELADEPRIDAICSHAHAYRECKSTELVAVCDINANKAARCAERWGLKQFYTDVDRLLFEQAPDIVSICTPNETHSPILEKVLMGRALRGILAEKPLALSLTDASRVVAHARERGVALVVNYSRRYSPRHWNVRELIQAGGIGEVQKVFGLYTKGLLHNGTHWLDLARWLVGDVAEICGFTASCQEQGDPQPDVRLSFRSGASGILQSCDDDAFTVFEMDILGRKGRIRLTDFGHQYEVYSVHDSPQYNGYRTLVKVQEEYGGVEDTLLYAVEDLVHCIKHGGQPRCSGDDGVEVLRIATSALNPRNLVRRHLQ